MSKACHVCTHLMPPRTAKHLTKRERKARDADSWLNEKGEEPCITLRGARLLCNILIEKGDANLDRAIKVLQGCNDQLKTGKGVVPCSHCAKKIGISQCSGCRSNTELRYCSRECQRAAWPSHKAFCGLNFTLSQVIDVD